MSYAQSNINWSIGSNIAANTFGNNHPRVTMDAAGNALVVWGRSSDQSVFFSRWTGASFSAPLKLNPSWMTVATASWMGPDIASHGDTVYIVVKRIPEEKDTNRIFLFSSFNGGVTFNTPLQLAFIADSLSRFPTVNVDANGNPIVAFMKFNANFLDSRWAVAKSSDFGNSFSTDIKASGFSGPTASVCDCCPGAVVSSGSTTAVIYRDNLNNVRDIWTGISTNNNATFASGHAVDNTNWMLMSCPASGPDGIMIDDTLYSTFMSGGSGIEKSYFSKSSISAGGIASVSSLTGSITSMSQQNFPRIASDGTSMAIVWMQKINGNTQLPILFTNKISNGFPPAYDTVDLNDITNADVALKQGTIFVVWEDDNSGTIKYRRGTYSTISTEINEHNENRISIYPNITSDYIKIELSENYSSPKKISISDIGGRKMFETSTTLNQIDISRLAAGQYILTIQCGNTQQNFKVTKK